MDRERQRLPDDRAEDFEGTQSFDPWRLLEVIRRRRISALVTVILLLPIAAVYPFSRDPVYQALSKLSIQAVPAVMSFGADFMPGMAGPSSRRNPLAAPMAFIKSNRVLGQVVDQYPPEPDKPRRVSWLAPLWDLLGSTPKKPVDLSPALRRHLRIQGLRRSISLSTEGGGSVLVISVQHRNPVRAAFLANAVADGYVQFDESRVRAASRTAIAWLSQKENELREQVERKRAALDDLVEKLGGEPQPVAGDADDSERRGLKVEQRKVQFDLFAVEQRLAELEPQVSALRGGPGEPQEQAAARLQYSQAVRDLENARLVYTETHPEIQRLESIVESLRGEAGTAPAPDDPLAQSRLQEYQQLHSQRAKLRARRQILETTLSQLEGASVENAPLVASYQRLHRELQMDMDLISVIQGRISHTMLSAARETASARVLDYAVMSEVSFSGGWKKRLAVSLAGIFAMALGVVAAREILDRAEYDPEHAAGELGAPVIASIPAVIDGTPPERQASVGHATAGGEAYRHLRTSLLYAGGDTPPRTLLIASAVAGEGKTTISLNLAESFAGSGRSVVLVDADLRRPRVSEILNLSVGPGLSEVLRGDWKLEDVIRRPLGLGFDVISSGEVPENPSELIGSPAFREVRTSLEQRYDLILFDAPVLLAVTDTLLIAAQVDGLVLVSSPGRADRRAFGRIARDLERVGARLLGLVANRVSTTDSQYYPSYLKSPYVTTPKHHWWQRRGRA